MSALAFAALALALAGPVPAALARARWTLRTPRAAVVLWQAVALAAVLSAFSAGLAIAARILATGPDGRTSVGSGIDVMGWPLWLCAVAVFAVTLLIGVRLMAAVVRVAVRTRRRRARHRTIVDLVGSHSHPGSPPIGQGDDLRVLRVRQPLAYCLPGIRPRIVLSEGTIATLSRTELSAILHHERAHLRARHDLVLEAFVAVHTAFPRFVRSGSALGAVRLLVELLADDVAARASGPAPLARALVACASSPAPAGALAAGGPTTVIRVRRLAAPPNSRPIALAAYLTAATVLVVPTIAVAVPWLTELARLFRAAT